MELYEFSNLEEYLNSIGIDVVKDNSGYKVIKGVSFEDAWKKGKIEFKEDGIYIDEYRGYMFIKEPYIEEYGNYPKFHLKRCKTIDKFILSGNFNIRYEWSNAESNDLIDKTTRKVYKNEVLNLCGNCRRDIYDDIDDTVSFHDLIKISKKESIEDLKVDSFGYVHNWPMISNNRRKENNWKCEECDIKLIENDRLFLHVHHIDLDKTNNEANNLKCLCILCHAFQDKTHISNFKDSKDLQSFITRKNKTLLQHKNPYMKRLKEINL